MKTVFPLVILISLIFFTCKKDKKNEPGTPPISTSGKISGKIALPEGTPVDINSLSVVSLIQTSGVKNETYELDSIAVPNYSTRFVLDADSNVVLMHYNYPGEKNDISSRTTALAMFMNTQSVSSLSESAKGSLISKITSYPSFDKLVKEIENSLKNGRSCIDTTNNELQKAFADLFTTASSLKKADQYSKPISIYRQDRQITLVNNGFSCSYVVGVYNEGIKVGEFIKFNGVEFAPTTLVDLLTGNYGVPELEEKQLQLEGDGKFEIKIRSGYLDDNTPESDAALFENRLKYIEFIYKSFILQFIKTNGCLSNLPIRIAKYMTPLPQLPKEFSLQEEIKVIHDVFINSLKFAKDIVGDCVTGDQSKSVILFLKGVGNYAKFLKFINLSGSTINITARILDFKNASPKIDTCFIALGNDVVSCSEMPQLKTDEAQYITESTAMIPVRIISDGGSEILDKGICYGTTPGPKLGGGAVSAGSGLGDFTSTLTNLDKNKKYYARAYAVIAKNNMVVYGNEISFTTLQISLPILTTSTVSSITQTSAISGGNIAKDGGADVIARGVCWSIYPNPTVELPTKTNDGAGSGNFVSNINGLIAGTTYYVRAYATNSAGAAYGEEMSFKTLADTKMYLTGDYYLNARSYSLAFELDLMGGSSTITVPEGKYPTTTSLNGTNLICTSIFDYSYTVYHATPTQILSHRTYIFSGELKDGVYSGDVKLTIVTGDQTTNDQGTFKTQKR